MHWFQRYLGTLFHFPRAIDGQLAKIAHFVKSLDSSTSLRPGFVVHHLYLNLLLVNELSYFPFLFASSVLLQSLLKAMCSCMARTAKVRMLLTRLAPIRRRLEIYFSRHHYITFSSSSFEVVRGALKNKNKRFRVKVNE